MKYIWFIFVAIVLFVATGNACYSQNRLFRPKLGMREDSALVISYGKQELIAYQFRTIYPPQGVDTNFKRSGFIHPLKTPHGQALTRIQPPDHFHHYGIWSAWTHTLFEKDTVDFWNLIKRSGSVRFVQFTAQKSTKKFVEFTALLEHVVFGKTGQEKIALLEWQTIRVYRPTRGHQSYAVDFMSTFRCATDSPLRILDYRYGGFVWRATDYWNRSNVSLISDSGKDRDHADSTRARWIMAYGSLPGDDVGGMLILSHPSNYNHPEPLRVWDKEANQGNGDLMLNFAPTRGKDWMLEPSKSYTLKYRMIVFNGKISEKKASARWQAFSRD